MISVQELFGKIAEKSPAYGNASLKPILMLCIALFVLAEGWLLLHIRWFVLFFTLYEMVFFCL